VRYILISFRLLCVAIFFIFHILFNFIKLDIIKRINGAFFIEECVLRQLSLRLSLESTLIRSPRLRDQRKRCLRIFPMRDLSRKIREKTRK